MMNYEATVLRDEHREAYAKFKELLWGIKTTAQGESLLPPSYKNPYEHQSPSPSTIILLMEDRVVGHLAGAIPCRIWCNGRESAMHWLTGLHVLPEVRGRGLAKLLILKMMELHPVLTGVLVVEASRKSFLRLGWHFDWTIPEFVKILNSHSFLNKFTGQGLRNVPRMLQKASSGLHGASRRVLSPVVAAANSIYQGIWRVGRGRSSLEIDQVDAFGVGVDELWLRNRYQLTCAQVRQSAYLNWCFNADRHWIKLQCTIGGKVIGYAVVSIRSFDDKAFHGMTLASVIDLFWDFEYPEAARALLWFSEDLGRQRRADAILCSGTDARARWAAVRSGFIRIPSTLWCGYYSADPAVQFPMRAREWFANRGDADAAGSLGPKE